MDLQAPLRVLCTATALLFTIQVEGNQCNKLFEGNSQLAYDTYPCLDDDYYSCPETKLYRSSCCSPCKEYDDCSSPCCSPESSCGVVCNSCGRRGYCTPVSCPAAARIGVPNSCYEPNCCGGRYFAPRWSPCFCRGCDLCCCRPACRNSPYACPTAYRPRHVCPPCPPTPCYPGPCASQYCCRAMTTAKPCCPEYPTLRTCRSPPYEDVKSHCPLNCTKDINEVTCDPHSSSCRPVREN